MFYMIQLLLVLTLITMCWSFLPSLNMQVKVNTQRLHMVKGRKSPLITLDKISKPSKQVPIKEVSSVADKTPLDSALDFLEEKNATVNDEVDEIDLSEIYEESPNIVIPYDLIAKLKQQEIEAEINKKTPQGVLNKEILNEAAKKWKLHENDVGSSEVQIAMLTERVKYLTKHLLINTHDYAAKRGLQLIVNQRRKLLNYLYDNNRLKAEEMIKVLGIRFRPPGQLWDKEAKYRAFKNTKNPIAKIRIKAKAKATRDAAAAAKANTGSSS